MAEKLLDEQYSSENLYTSDFSTLAWKFNNLNSTAKMLLVGSNPSSVPFIPISDLISSEEGNVTTYQTPAPSQELSISSLAAPSISTKQPNIQVAPREASKVAPKVSPQAAPIQKTNTSNLNKQQNDKNTESKKESFNVPSFKEDKQSQFKTVKKSDIPGAATAAISGSAAGAIAASMTEAPNQTPVAPIAPGPVPAKEKQEATRNVPLNPQASSSASEQKTKPQSNPKVSTKATSAQAISEGITSDFLSQPFNVSTIGSSHEPEHPLPPQVTGEGLPSTEQGPNLDTSSLWSYKGVPAEEEEEYYSLREELSRKNKAGVGPFFRKTAKTAAIVSLIALLGFGAYNLFKKSPEKDIESYVNDQDDLDEDLSTDPLSDRIESIDGNGSTSLNNTDRGSFFEERTSSSTTSGITSSSRSTKSSQSSTSSSNASNTNSSYYQPTVRSKSRTIKPSKPKVYSASPKVTSKISSKPAIQTSTTTRPSFSSSPYQSSATSNPTGFLYDPATIYDSSSTEAISPETYTAARFPIEISYAKSGEQYQAPLAANISGTENNSTTSPETNPEINYVPSGYPVNNFSNQALPSPYSSGANAVNADMAGTTYETTNESSDFSSPSSPSATPSSNTNTYVLDSNSLTPEEQNIPSTNSYSAPSSSNYSTPSIAQPSSPSLQTIPSSSLSSSNSISVPGFDPQKSVSNSVSTQEAAPQTPSYYPQFKSNSTENTVDNNPSQSQRLNTTSGSPSPIYTQPTSNVDQQLNVQPIQSSSDDIDLSVPVLRQPVESSSNDLNLNAPLPSPYKSSAPLTTSSYVIEDPKQNYQPQRGRISRFLDRFKGSKSLNSSSNKVKRDNLPSRAAEKTAQRLAKNQEALTNQNSIQEKSFNSYQNKIDEFESKAASSSLNDSEKQKLLEEIENVKKELISSNNSFNQSSVSLSKNIEALEEDASNVYVETSPYEASDSIPANGSTLNIS